MCVYYGHYHNILQAQNVDNWQCPDFRGIGFLAGFVLWHGILLLHLFWKGRRTNCEQSWGYDYCRSRGLHMPWDIALCLKLTAETSLQVTGRSSAGHIPGITPGTCSCGRLVELVGDVGSTNHSNTKPVFGSWMRSCTNRSPWRSPHSPASTERQAPTPMEAGTSWASGATGVLLKREVFKAFQTIFPLKPCCAPRQMPHAALPRLKEGLPDTGRVAAGFIPASLRAEVYAKVQFFSYLETFHRWAVPPLQQTRLWSHASKATDATTEGLSVRFQNGFQRKSLTSLRMHPCFFHRISCAVSLLPLFTLPFQLLLSQNTTMEHLKQQGWVGMSFPAKCCGELSALKYMGVIKKQIKYDPTASHRSFIS